MSINVQVSTTPNVQIVAFPNIQVSTSPNIQVSGSANVQVLVENSSNSLNLTSLGHNDLLGLQGGQNNQYYHLNSGQYNNLVYNTGNQSISGAKTFIELPYIPLTPTIDTHASSKGYVDITYQNAISGWVKSEITGLSGATVLANIVQITQSGYNAITPTPLDNALYIIVG